MPEYVTYKGKRLMLHKGKLRKPIHFEFRPHMEHVPVKKFPKNAGAVILEHAPGIKQGFSFDESFLRQNLSNSSGSKREVTLLKQI